MIFSAVIGFAGSLISLAISKWIAKRSTGARVIETPQNAAESWLLNTVQRQARDAGIGCPEVAIYDSPDINAFATGMSRNNALVAVSTGLLSSMGRDEVEAVLGHAADRLRMSDVPRDVVFDLGGVLVDWDPRHLLCGHLGYTAEGAEWVLRHVCTREWHTALDGGRRFAEAAAELARVHPEHASVIEAYTREWRKMFAGEHRGSVRILEALKSAGFRLHALSNYPRDEIAFLYRRFAFMREFDTVVLSGLVGIQKPSARIYEYLFDRLGTRECVFLDDRPENVAAARACGITAIQYTPPPADAEVEHVFQAAGLRELLGGRLPNRN